jgi:protein-disulfide isomerase
MTKKLATFIIIFVCMSAIYGIKLFVASSQADTEIFTGRIKGSIKAPLQVIEFIDFQCPACASGAQYLKKFMEEHPDVIRLEMKYFPLKMHKHAFLSCRYAECASRQGKFWAFHDQLIENQIQWKELLEAQPVFDFMAEEVGMDIEKLKICLGDELINEVINYDKVEGKTLGVRSTPSYFINGKMVVGPKTLKLELDKVLEKGL